MPVMRVVPPRFCDGDQYVLIRSQLFPILAWKASQTVSKIIKSRALLLGNLQAPRANNNQSSIPRHLQMPYPANSPLTAEALLAAFTITCCQVPLAIPKLPKSDLQSMLLPRGQGPSGVPMVPKQLRPLLLPQTTKLCSGSLNGQGHASCSPTPMSFSPQQVPGRKQHAQLNACCKLLVHLAQGPHLSLNPSEYSS